MRRAATRSAGSSPVAPSVTAARPAAEPPESAVPEHRQARASGVSVRTLVTAALIVLAVAVVVFLLAQIVSIVLLVLVAIVFAEGIRPLVERLTRMRWPQPLAIITVYVALLAFLAALIALLVQPIVSEAQQLASNFPTYQRNFLSFFHNLETQLHFNVDISKQIAGALGAAQQVLFTIGATIFGVLVNFVLVLVIGFLWLVSSERLKKFSISLVPIRHQSLATDILREIGFRMGGYLRAVAINSLAVGVATGVASAILGLPSPILLGIFAGLAGAIPIVGAVLGVVPPFLLAFTIGPGWAVLVLGVMLFIQLVDANTVVPIVLNRAVALPALGVVLALLIGGTLQGVIGALLAVPVAAAIQVIILRVLVPVVYYAQGRYDEAYNTAYQTLTPKLKEQEGS